MQIYMQYMRSVDIAYLISAPICPLCIIRPSQLHDNFYELPFHDWFPHYQGSATPDKSGFYWVTYIGA